MPIIAASLSWKSTFPPVPSFFLGFKVYVTPSLTLNSKAELCVFVVELPGIVEELFLWTDKARESDTNAQNFQVFT